MTEFVIIPLGNSGETYVERCLSEGRGLSARMISRLKDGTSYAVVPQGTKIRRAEQFSTGGFTSMSECVSWLSKYVCNKLVENVGTIYIVHDIWMSGRQINIDEVEGVKAILENDCVYYFPKIDNNCIFAIEKLFRVNSSFTFVSFILENAANCGDFSTDIENFDTKVVEIIIGAYDQEGFIIWRKQADRILQGKNLAK